jgi:hypothetical protein
MRSKAPWLLALPALILALYLALGSEKPPPKEPAEAAPATEAPPSQAEIDLDIPAAQRAPGIPQPATAIDQAEALAPPAAAAAQVPAGSGVLSGTLRFIDASGRTLPDVNMELVLTLQNQNSRLNRDLKTPVRAGRWSVKVGPLAGNSSLRLNPLVRLGQLCPPVQPAEAVALPIDGPLDLIYRLPEPVLLRVYSSNSGSEQAEVWLAEDLEGGWLTAGHPGAESLNRVVKRGLASPLDVTQLDWYRRKGPMAGEKLSLLVGGPECAWVRSRVPLLAGGTYRVELPPAAELIVEVEGLPTPGIDLHLRIYAEGAEHPLCSMPLKSIGAQRFRGLAPGILEARAEIGEWFLNPIPVSAEQALLVGGETTHLRLALPEQAAVAYGRLTGMVLWPPGWPVDDQASMDVMRMDASRIPTDTSRSISSGALKQRNINTLDANAPRLVRLQAVPGTDPGWTTAAFDIPEVETGRYQLTVHTGNASFLAQVEAQAGPPLELRIGAPAELVLCFVDAMTGMAIRPEAVHWCPERALEAHRTLVQQAPFDNSIEAHRLVGPEGTIRLMVDLEGYTQLHVSDLAIGPGKPQERRFELQRVGELLVRLTSDGELLPMGAGVELQVLRADTHEPIVAGFIPEGHQRRLSVPANGRYLVQPPDIPGFVAPQAREILILPDEPAELVYEYQRLR